ncbi:L-selectin-like [Amphibalanus amphitrite]|nr:L-selectin-like [Amphibalanus amphitrite]
MRLLLPVAVVALAGVATASYGPPVASHYGGRGGGVHVGGGGAVGGAIAGGAIGGSGSFISGGSHGGSHGAVGGGGYYQGGLFLSFLAPETSHYEYTWQEAAYQCASRGLVLVSIENYEKDHYIASLLRKYHVPFIWTSGTKHGYSFRWVNGKTIGPYSYSNWSRTGGNGYPQPDNREGHEYCLAVLNEFYHDGIVWHDIACHHKKAFICERPAKHPY